MEQSTESFPAWWNQAKTDVLDLLPGWGHGLLARIAPELLQPWPAMAWFGGEGAVSAPVALPKGTFLHEAGGQGWQSLSPAVIQPLTLQAVSASGAHWHYDLAWRAPLDTLPLVLTGETEACLSALWRLQRSLIRVYFEWDGKAFPLSLHFLNHSPQETVWGDLRLASHAPFVFQTCTLFGFPDVPTGQGRLVFHFQTDCPQNVVLQTNSVLAACWHTTQAIPQATVPNKTVYPLRLDSDERIARVHQVTLHHPLSGERLCLPPLSAGGQTECQTLFRPDTQEIELVGEPPFTGGILSCDVQAFSAPAGCKALHHEATNTSLCPWMPPSQCDTPSFTHVTEYSLFFLKGLAIDTLTLDALQHLLQAIACGEGLKHYSLSMQSLERSVSQRFQNGCLKACLQLTIVLKSEAMAEKGKTYLYSHLLADILKSLAPVHCEVTSIFSITSCDERWVFP